MSAIRQLKQVVALINSPVSQSRTTKFVVFALSILLSSTLLNAAELSDTVSIYDDMIPGYFERADIVAFGYFEIVEDQIPHDNIGKRNDNWNLNFSVIRSFKTLSGETNTISVNVRNDILPYRNWGISRKDIRVFKELGYSDVVKRWAEVSDILELENSQGLITDREIKEMNQLLNETMLSNFPGPIQFSPGRSSRGIVDRLILPKEPYLVFLKYEDNVLRLIEEEWGFNLFAGMDAILLMRTFD